MVVRRAPSSSFGQQLSVYVMYVLIFLCVGFGLQTLFAFERVSDDDLVSEYLLHRRGDALLRLSSKPKLWVPFPKNQNRLQQGFYWKSFLDRSTEADEVQIQFLQLSLRSLERHNAEHFQIVLVDDSTFAKLIPAWQLNRVDIERCASEGMKNYLRRIGMLQLLYLHGGMVVPPSFLCTSSLKDAFDAYTDNGRKPFFGESVCENGRIGPSTRVMGAPAKHFLLKDMVEMLVARSFGGSVGKFRDEFSLGASSGLELLPKLLHQHFEHSEAFQPFLSQWIHEHCATTRDANLLPGELLAICTATRPRRIIGVEQWFYRVSDDITNRTFGELERRDQRLCGIDFPLDRAMLTRQYRWIAKSKISELLRMNNVLGAALKVALEEKPDRNDDAEILGI